MSRESIPRAFLFFLANLPKAFRSLCWIYMFVALGIYIFVGYRLAAALCLSPDLEQPTTGLVITSSLIILWLVAFSMGVKLRPVKPEIYLLYPPGQVIGGSLTCSFVFVMVLGVTVGHVLGVGILRSLLYAFLGILPVPFIVNGLFLPTIRRTKTAVRTQGDKGVVIADAYRGMWVFPAFSVIAVYGFSRWIGGEFTYASPYLIAVSASLMTAVFSTGYASGYYP